MAHLPSDFLGAWSLVDWRVEYEDGGVTRPFGTDATGYILYTAEGIMAATITKAGRLALDVTNPRVAGDSAKGAAFDSYFNYAGAWRIEGDTVVHSVTMALNPNMTGTEQPRLATFDGKGGLTLSAEEKRANGKSRSHIIQWRRINP